MAIKISAADRRAIDKAATVLEAQGYDAFIRLIEANKANHERKIA